MKMVVAFIVGLVLLPIIAFVWAWSGHFPIATASAPLPLEQRLAKLALHQATHRPAPPGHPPVTADVATLTAAAQLYHTECAFCHGQPGQPEPNAAKGMFPPPPQLAEDVDDDPQGQIYWRIQNGIRLTGMPAFGATLSQQQIWQLIEFLPRINQLPAPAQAALNGH